MSVIHEWKQQRYQKKNVLSALILSGFLKHVKMDGVVTVLNVANPHRVAVKANQLL